MNNTSNSKFEMNAYEEFAFDDSYGKCSHCSSSVDYFSEDFYQDASGAGSTVDKFKIEPNDNKSDQSSD